MQHYDGGVVMHIANVGIADLFERSNTSPTQAMSMPRAD